MKKLTLSLLLALSLLTGCASRTPFGECIGINDEPSPKLVYKYSAQNIVVGALFAETVVVPALVIFTQIKCPTANRYGP